MASYTGDPISPTITTTPAGLKVNLTYNKSPVVPHEAGTYEVIASIEDATYSGTAKSVFEITKSSTAMAVDDLVISNTDLAVPL